MAVPFSDLYLDVRVATGNDDPDIGSEVMPDNRVDVLLKTAIRSLPSYSRDFPELDFQTNASVFEVILASNPTASINRYVLLGLCYAAAHRYFVGIGNKAAASDAFVTAQNFAEVYAGSPMKAENEQTLPTSLQKYTGKTSLTLS